MTDEQEITHYQTRIKEMLARVPTSVNAGSYDNAVAFKKAAAVAKRAAENQRPRLLAIKSAHGTLAQYY